LKLAGGSFKLATRYFMYWLGLSVQVTCVALQSWILALLWRRNLWRKFPIFTGYIAYVLVRTVVGSATLPILTSTSFLLDFRPRRDDPDDLAAHESFLRVFRSFLPAGVVRIFFPGAIV